MTRTAASLVLVAIITFAAACGPTTAQPQAESQPPPRLKSKKVSDEERLEALSRAGVWQQPRIAIARARLGSAPDQPATLECLFAATDVDGTAPKFDCDVPGGDRIRDTIEGWALSELDALDEKKGGAPRAHVDALRLLAVMIAHWDNKSENQRLVCLSEKDWPEGGRCSRPMAMLQDVGAAFGPRKVDLKGWEGAQIWGNRARCIATMEKLPYEGATFKAVPITEAGRQHLAGLLGQLSQDQITELFAAARFDHATRLVGRDQAPVREWVRVFNAKVRQISDGPPCPQ